MFLRLFNTVLIITTSRTLHRHPIMPAPVTSPLPARTAIKASSATKPRGLKKTRIVRRRGRGKDDIGSDDEIEREVGTDSEDSEEEQGELSSLDSDSDSDTEPASDDVIPNGHHVLTPSTSRGPDDVQDGHQTTVGKDSPSFFNGGGNWSEMVTDENVNGPADLPVIDFAEFDGHSVPAIPSRVQRPPNKAPKKSRPPAPQHLSPPAAPGPVAEEHGDLEADPVASTSRHPPLGASNQRRPPGQTARQAYQHRLESDPSYVPTVGEFWGHDDRLLDKDLRSLSGWWRGRWQGRGSRGRGGFDRGFSARGRGRGGGSGPANGGHWDGQVDSESFPQAEVPPIDRAWTHDGFEEMKQREDSRRGGQQTFRGVGGFRGTGRGGFIPRGRGGGFARGGFVPSPARSRVGSPLSLPPGRPWFVMKPERMWTKQHEGFLHFDATLKPRPGQGLGIRVKLPGDRAQIIRAAPSTSKSSVHPGTSKPATTSIVGSDYGDKAFVVRLPKPAPEKEAVGQTLEVESVAHTDETPIEEVFTVRPQLVARNAPIPFSQPADSPVFNGSSPAGTSSQLEPAGSFSDGTYSQAPPESVQQQLEHIAIEPQNVDPVRWAQTEEAVMKHPHTSHYGTTVEEQPESSSANDSRPPLPPLQTVFTPPEPQSSPVAYGSPYGYAPALPPGIAVDQHGMPYELATGRPVYLQPPSLMPMYNPRPMMHMGGPPGIIPFVPGHMHHHSAVSPDFLAPSNPHTPPINGFLDPSTGAPIFSLPRQNSRIEIRAPTEGEERSATEKDRASRRTSTLRTTAATFEPSQPSENAHNTRGYFPPLTAPTSYEMVDAGMLVEDGNAGQHQDPSMMTYSPYQQYYYPDAYGYNPYMDMSQVGPYEMYPPDPRASQPTVYY